MPEIIRINSNTPRHAAAHAPGATAAPAAPRDARRGSFLVFGAPTIGPEETNEVLDCLRTGWLGTGPKVARFERAFADYKDAPHAVAVNSCTAALHLSMLAAGVGPGDEVITTPLTFCATINAIIHTGATPVLADVDPRTMNLDPDRVRGCVTPRTKAVLPVHFAGRPCPMGEILDLARARGLVVIEDCAHAIETEADGARAGTLGDFGCFSFYVTKNVITGEGGMILAKRAEDAARLKSLALHGMSQDAWKRFSDDGYRHYDVVEAGFKCNMMDLQAAIGLHSLRRVEAHWARRRAIWARYQEAFAPLPVTRPAEPDAGTRHAHHLYTLLVDERTAGIDRDAFLDVMKRRNIGTGVHYRAAPEHRYYRERFGWRAEDYPNSIRIGRTTVSLPLAPNLTDADIKDVITAVRDSLAEARTAPRRIAA